jgi:hypothetical protein
MKKQIITLAGVLGLSVIAHGAIIAYEGFDYAEGSLIGQNGGTGWASGGWTLQDGNAATVTTPGMQYDGMSNLGGKAQIIADSSNNAVAMRYLNTSLNSSSGVVWASFTGQKTLDGNRYINFAFFNNDTEGFALGHGTWAARNWTLNRSWSDPAGNTSVSTGASMLNESFLLMKFTFNEIEVNNDLVEVWVNPTLANGEAGLGTSTSLTGNWDFNRIRLAAGGGSSTTPSGGIFDEIRLGTEFTDVIPEPATLGLVGMIGIGLIAARRFFAI